ncbi:metalloprotease [archaeon]|nr:metalloprotease [archaeon]
MHDIHHVNPHFQRGIKTSRKEIIDLAKAWIILGVAFAIAMNGLKFDITLFIALFISLITIGIGFLFHELAHKFMAQRYGCFAEFRSFDHMLILALIMSFFGFIFAAPGAVMIQGRLSRRQNSLISAAGPGMNMLVALIFLGLLFTGAGIWHAIGIYGFTINSWLAAFNLIPFAMFDGAKVWDGSKALYIIMVVIGLGLIVLQNLLKMGTI